MSTSQRSSWETQYRGNGCGDDGRPGGDVAPHIDWSRQDAGSETIEAAVARMCAEEMAHPLVDDREPRLKEQTSASAIERRVGDRRGDGNVLRLVPQALTPPVAAAPEPSRRQPWPALAVAALMAGLGLGFWGGSKMLASSEVRPPAATPVPTLRLDTDIETLGRRVSTASLDSR